MDAGVVMCVTMGTGDRAGLFVPEGEWGLEAFHNHQGASQRNNLKFSFNGDQEMGWISVCDICGVQNLVQHL